MPGSSASAIATSRLERALLRARIQRKRQPAPPAATAPPHRKHGGSKRAAAVAADEEAAEEDPSAPLVCSVCLQDMEPEAEDENALRTLACGHCFHRDCLAPWLERKHSCPLCRQPASGHAEPPPAPSPPLQRRQRRHRCGNPNVIQLRGGLYCAGCMRWLEAHEDLSDDQRRTLAVSGQWFASTSSST